MLLWQQHLTSLHQNVAHDSKAVVQNMQNNFSTNVGETEDHLWRHLLYDGAFGHCSNQLVKLTPLFVSIPSSQKQQKSEHGRQHIDCQDPGVKVRNFFCLFIDSQQTVASTITMLQLTYDDRHR
jgi:hypothetical protein